MSDSRKADIANPEVDVVVIVCRLIGIICHSARVSVNPPGTLLGVGANDAPRSDVGKVALCEFVVSVVMQDYEAPGRCGAADQQIDDRQNTHCTGAGESALRRIDPPPHGFRHGHIRVKVTKSLVHLIELVRIARRSTKLGSLWFARSDGTAEK